MPERRHKPADPSDFSRYFQDELTYLEDLGAEHARQDPGRSHFDFAAIGDPDVLCLLQGFSFLTARIRQNLDDELPEISHTLLGLLFPHYLRPTPSMTVVQFTPGPGSVQSRLRLAAGTTLSSKPVDGIACSFRTSYDVDLVPLSLERCRLERGEGREATLRLRFAAVGPTDLAKIDLSTVRVYFKGGGEDARVLRWLLSTQVESLAIEWRKTDNEPPTRVERSAAESIRSVGFECDEPGELRTSLLPFPARSFGGYRLLQEYFAYPNKFHFLDLVLTDDAEGRVFGDATKLKSFEVELRIPDAPNQLPQIDETRLALHCAPVVNLFDHDAEPIVVDYSRTEYVVRPRGGGRRQFEVWSVESVTATEPSSREIPSFFSLRGTDDHRSGAAMYFEPRLRPARLGFVEGEDEQVASGTTDTYLRFVNSEFGLIDPGAQVGPLPASVLPPSEKLSIELLCTNRFLPLQLEPGDINVPTGDVPKGITFKGIERITPPVAPPLGDLVLWRLLSHLSLNRLSLTNVDVLRGLLEVYDFHARSDAQAMRRSQRRLAALRKVVAVRRDAFYRGAHVPLVETALELDDGGFMGVGDMHLFGAVLERFVALNVSVNCLSRLRVRVPTTGLEFEFPARAGSEEVL